jgi:hypothetical protein
MILSIRIPHPTSQDFPRIWQTCFRISGPMSPARIKLSFLPVFIANSACLEIFPAHYSFFDRSVPQQTLLIRK